jgi:hypothetical protein
MNPNECPREHDVVSRLLAQSVEMDDELSAHVSTCEVCREAADVARLMREDARQGRADAHVPAAAQVWWRAAIRARVEATQSAERPLTWVHGVAAAGAAGASLTAFGMFWPSIAGAFARLTDRSWAMPPIVSDAANVAVSSLQSSLPLALVALAGLVLAPLAAYLVTSDD